MLVPGTFYHIYNRANGFDKLFLHSGNYSFFLQKYAHYISPIADTKAICLMPNHFHALVRIKDFEMLMKEFSSREKLKVKLDLCSEREEKMAFIMRQLSRVFGNLFSCYAQAFNKVNERHGSLFQKNFKAKIVDTTHYYHQVLTYIYLNPLEAGLVSNPSEWHWTFLNFSKVPDFGKVSSKFSSNTPPDSSNNPFIPNFPL